LEALALVSKIAVPDEKIARLVIFFVQVLEVLAKWQPHSTTYRQNRNAAVATHHCS